MIAMEFDLTKTNDSAYCLDFMNRRIAAYNTGKSKKAQILLHEQDLEGRTMYGVIDMMTCVGTYSCRTSARNAWGNLQKHTFIKRFWVSFEAHSNRMDFCTLQDFMLHVFPRIKKFVSNKHRSNYVYAIKPRRANFIKVGRWNGTCAKLNSRYVTYFGDIETTIFQCTDNNEMERLLFSHLSPFLYKNELFEVDALPYFISFCQLHSCKLAGPTDFDGRETDGN